MAIFRRAIKTAAPTIDPRIRERVVFSSTVKVPQKIIELFEIVFSKVADQIENDKITNLPKVNCILTRKREVSIVLGDEEVAICCTLCIYPIDKWLLKYSEIQICAIITEELCHVFWGIENEYDVCYKVWEVVRRISPEVKIEELYNMDEAKRLGRK